MSYSQQLYESHPYAIDAERLAHPLPYCPTHCRCWLDGDGCCRCKAPAVPFDREQDDSEREARATEL